MDWENELLAMLRKQGEKAKYELNEERWRFVKEEIENIADYFLEDNSEAKIEFQMLPHFAECCGLIVKVTDMFTTDVKQFCNLICNADNMAITVSKEGYVQFEFTFCDIAKCVY